MTRLIEPKEFKPMPETYYEYLEEQREGLGEQKLVRWAVPLTNHELRLLYLKRLYTL